MYNPLYRKFVHHLDTQSKSVFCCTSSRIEKGETVDLLTFGALTAKERKKEIIHVSKHGKKNVYLTFGIYTC